MTTFNIILKELKNVPVNRLADLYSIIHSLGTNKKKTDIAQKQILSFAGSFNDMDQNDYNDFIEETKRTRSGLFNREFNI